MRYNTSLVGDQLTPYCDPAEFSGKKIGQLVTRYYTATPLYDLGDLISSENLAGPDEIKDRRFLPSQQKMIHDVYILPHQDIFWKTVYLHHRNG